MTSAQLLETLAQRGVRLFLADGKLRYKTTRGRLPVDLQALIREYGAELLALLQTPAALQEAPARGAGASPTSQVGSLPALKGGPSYPVGRDSSRCRCSEADALWAEDAAMLVLIAWFREEPGTRPTPWSLDDGRVIEEQDRWPFLFGLWDEVLLGPNDPGAGQLKGTLKLLHKFFLEAKHSLGAVATGSSEGR